MREADHVVMRHALEDAEERRLRTQAEPLAAQLHPGINYLTPEEFLLLLEFFEETIDDPEPILKSGKARIYGTFTLVRVRAGCLLSILEIAKMGGVTRQAAAKWVARSKVPFCFRGRKKLYNVSGLQL